MHLFLIRVNRFRSGNLLTEIEAAVRCVCRMGRQRLRALAEKVQGLMMWQSDDLKGLLTFVVKVNLVMRFHFNLQTQDCLSV